MHKCYELSVSVGVSGGRSPAWSSSQRSAVAHRVLGRWSPAHGGGSGKRAGRGRGARSGWNRREVAHSPGSSSGAGWHPFPAAEETGEQDDRWGWRMRGARGRKGVRTGLGGTPSAPRTVSTEDGLCILGASSLPGSFTCPFGRLGPLMTLVTFAGVAFPESCCRGSRVARCGPGPFCHPEKVLGELQAQPHHWPEAAGLQLPPPPPVRPPASCKGGGRRWSPGLPLSSFCIC